MRKGDLVTFGAWPKEWENFPEPLQWRVLQVNPDGSALMITKDIIECRSFHDKQGNITWQNCTLRYWLNTVFFMCAFTPEERTHVAETEQQTANNQYYTTRGGGDTEDRVFCLSTQQVSLLLREDETRKAKPTDYAQRLANTSWWWLRSPGGHQFASAAVSDEGALDHNGFHATLDCIGVRPAIIYAPDSAYASECFADSVSFQTIGQAFRYADVQAACEMRARERLHADTALVALSGGWPSVCALEEALNTGIFDESDCFHFCHAAITMRSSKLALKLLEDYSFGKERLNMCLKAAVETGSREVTCALMDAGASGAGYAKAYIKKGNASEVALCAFEADPAAALDCWDALQTMPEVLSYLLESYSAAGQMKKVQALPGILEVVSRYGLADELQLLFDANSSFTEEEFFDAIQAAKRAGQTAIVAYLLDKQASLRGNSSASGTAGGGWGGPLLEL